MTEITFKRAAGASIALSLLITPTHRGPSAAEFGTLGANITASANMQKDKKDMHLVSDALRGDDANASAICKMPRTGKWQENKKIMEPVAEAFRRNDIVALRSFSGDAPQLEYEIIFKDIQNPPHHLPRDNWYTEGRLLQLKVNKDSECKPIWWSHMSNSYQNLKDNGINAAQLGKVFSRDGGEIKLVGFLRFDTEKQKEKLLAGIPSEPADYGFVRVLETDKFLEILARIDPNTIYTMASELGPFPPEYKQYYILPETGK